MLPLPGLAPSQAALRGFPADAVAAERQREEQFRKVPDSAKLKEYMTVMAGEPHVAGRPGSKKVADYAVQQFKSWGLDARIETFEALMPWPTERVVEMVAPTRAAMAIKEPVLSEDPDTSDADSTPVFNAYSADGDATGDVVYVNYGMPADYERLKAMKVDVKGKVVLARYGGGWRGIKPKVAYEHGAVACLIYSDPRDDGYYAGDVYPEGPYRPEQGVQRGSVMDMPIHPGDPLSPGWASEPGGKKLTREEAKTILKIPVLPISYGDALPLLKALKGPVAPAEWRGALPVTYHVGPGSGASASEAGVRMAVSSAPQRHRPDRRLDVPRRVGHLRQSPRRVGERRRRSDQRCRGADGDGPRPRGAVEDGMASEAHDHPRVVGRRGMGAARLDGVGREARRRAEGQGGRLHQLRQHRQRLAQRRRLAWPAAVDERSRARRHGPAHGEACPGRVTQPAGARARRSPSAQPERRTPRYWLSPLGSGSDYTPFLQHLTLASINVGFGGESNGGIYHSMYDTVNWYTKFSDGDFAYGRALSQVTGTLLLRLADAPVLPFQFTDTANTFKRYVSELEALARTRKDASLDFGPVRKAVDALGRAAPTTRRPTSVSTARHPRHSTPAPS